MIIFYADNFKLNLTTVAITFVEENALFFNSFFKNYSLPFNLPIDDETSRKLGLIDVDNVSNYTVKYQGNLLLDYYFEAATLLIEVENGNLECTLYFGKTTEPILETPLSSLPFPVLKNTTLTAYAENTHNKVWPEASLCFPMLFDDSFVNETNYEYFKGIINNYTNNYYLHNSVKLKHPSYNFFVQNRGYWDASVETFPSASSYTKGDYFIVNTAGTIDGISFEVDDVILAIATNPSSSTYHLNWIKTSVTEFESAVANENIMVPFPYVMEILKVGFAASGRELIGDFTTNKVNNHLIIDPKKHLEKFSTSTYDEFQFNNTTDEYLSNGVLFYQYRYTNTLTSLGSYKLKAFLNLPSEVTGVELEVKLGSTIIYTAVGNALDNEISINKESNGTETLTVTLKMHQTSVNVYLYNNFELEKNEGKLNIFKNSFSLAEFMPDMTFGTFLNKIKNWLNLKIVISDQYVRIDYVETKFLEVDFKDETKFEIKTPKREFNQAKIYKLKYSDSNYILIDKTGRVNNTLNYTEENIVEIDMDLEVLPVESRDGLFTAVRSDNDFSLLLYNGTNSNGLPVAVEAVEGVTFKLSEIADLYWYKWLLYRLNSETYTDSFKAHALEEFKINEGRFKYNKKHLYKTIQKTRVSEEEWNFEIESETF